MHRDLNTRYYKWLISNVCDERFESHSSFTKLLKHLHEITFIYSMDLDSSRAYNGKKLRYAFVYKVINSNVPTIYVPDSLNQGPCSVLEMMIGLAVDCEENIMSNDMIGDRTGQWFWGMITSLGLGGMTDDNYDEKYIDSVIETFHKHEYSKNGRGGLFTVWNTREDLRNMSIWEQMCAYLNTIIQ